jgi:Tfp pilus assembly protein PilF
LLERAQAALADGENFRARRFFRAAAEIAPLDGDWVTMSAAAEERLAPLGQELDRFRDGDYDFLINALWRRREAEPSNRDVQRMLVDAYYNLGVLDLQRGDPAGAREKFREARGIDATDPEIQRLERFATTYENRAQDLLYRIFVKYAPLR